MKVSVVICAYTMDRWDSLIASVQSSFNQTLAPFEVIVVIDYNDELLERATKEFTNASVVANQSIKGLSGARNTGVALALGNVVAFLDDDAFADESWLDRLTEPLADPKVAGAGGWILPHWEGQAAPWFPQSFYWILGCSYTGLPETNATIRNPIGANMAIRRSVFTEVGGFSSGLGRIGLIPLGCEETELCIRYTKRFPDTRFVLTREAVVHHRVPASRLTWRYFWTRCWAEGLSKAAVSSLVGPGRGLAAERRHVMTSLPRELARSLMMLRRDPRTAATRSALIVAGSLCAAAGLLRGRMAVRRNPLEASSEQLDLMTPESMEDLERGNAGGPVVAPWHPIKQMQVDVDSLDRGSFPVSSNERVWVEAVRRGQVVGVMEARTENGTLSDSFVAELSSTFLDVELSPYWTVPDELLPRASVVVPTICRYPDRLVRMVEALLDLDYPDFEIVVVDNRVESHPAPLPSLPGGEKVRVVVETKLGVAAARNRGVATSTGDFVAFTDDDVLVEPQWLRALGARFVIDADVDGIGGLVLPGELATEPQLWFEEFYGGFSQSFQPALTSVLRVGNTDKLFPYAPGSFGAGCNMAFRRSALERNGCFNGLLGTGTPARGGEDIALFIDVLLHGGTLAFEPAALVRHFHRRTEAEFMSQVFGYGVGLTAMYTALIVSDPRHLAEMLRRVPAGLRLLTRPAASRSPSSKPSYPRRTPVIQLLGMVYGPLAYLRSWMGIK
jgi:glycosyltransferase involved in cell wall biosynthesis